MFRLCMACMVLVAAGAHAAALTEDSCSVIVSKEGEKPDLHSVAGLSALSLRPDHPLMMRAEGGVKIHGVACWRSEAQLAENDYLVTDAGFPQSIKDGVISGVISTELQLIRTHKTGDSYSFREDDLVDWMVARPDGSEEGNVVGKFLDTYQR